MASFFVCMKTYSVDGSRDVFYLPKAFFWINFFILSLFLGVAGGEESLEKGFTFEFPLWEEAGFIYGSMSCILVDASGALLGSPKAGSKPCPIGTSRSLYPLSMLSDDPSNPNGCLDLPSKHCDLS